MKKKQTTEGAITLIALVVTIVVLLILAGVTINLLLGENGIITKAKKAAFATELSRVEERVKLKKLGIEEQQAIDDTNINLFDETLEQRSDIEIPDTFKQEVMYLRDNKPADKSQSDYNVEEFNISGLLVIDEQTGNGKKDTYAYDEITGIVLKIPQTKIGGKVYHSLESDGVSSSGTGGGTIQDEASVVNVDDEYYYEPDLKGFDGKNTQVVYYSSDFTKQITKTAGAYINGGKQNTITESGTSYQFHNYKNQQWANVKTTANGQEGWWVWIPRYAYKVNGTSNTDEPIGVIYIDLENKPLNPKYGGTLPEGYEVHPAFTPSGEDGSKNLKGIWMSKYEPSYAPQIAKNYVLAPDMTGFDRENTYIELYDSATETFSSEVKLADADLGSINSSKQWYDYSKQQYANIKTTANGQEGWWVWIPRYAYRKDMETTKQIMNIIFVDENDKPLDTKVYPDGLPPEYEVHPAFNLKESESSTKKLKGIWMSKYEPSYTSQIAKNYVLAPDMTGFDRENTYIELYDSTTGTFSSEVKLADADLDSVNSSKQWYDYSKQQYANIKTTAKEQEGWWVWIPRYAYRKDFDTSKQIMNIIFVDENDEPLDTKAYPDGLPLGYEVHPAFNLKESDGSIKKLKGIWFSKYEPIKK